jgi:hypothetical protein
VSIVTSTTSAWRAVRFESKGVPAVIMATAVKRAGFVKVGITTRQPGGSNLFRGGAAKLVWAGPAHKLLRSARAKTAKPV